MAEGKLDRYWSLITILLIAIAVIGGTIVWARYSPQQPVEISMPQTQELQGEIYIGGAINNPGIYPLKAGDSVDTLIQAAGGPTDTADLNQLRFYIPESGDEPAQKIDLNRAEVWAKRAFCLLQI